MALKEPSVPQPNLYPSDSYAFYLQSCLKNNNPITGKPIHARSIKAGLHFSAFLTNTLINFYAKTNSISDARRLFEEMPLRNIFSWNSILSAYAKSKRIDVARRVFDEMPERDSVSWTAMIVGYNQMGLFKDAILMFLEMIQERVAPTQFTLTNILASCVSLGALNLGKKLHTFVIKLGLSGNIPVANSLLNMYGKTGDTIMAEVIFDRMRLRSLSSWNTMVSLYAQCGQLDLAWMRFEAMEERDIVSWNAMVAGYNQHGFDQDALLLFSQILKEPSLQSDGFTFTSVLSACANLKLLKTGKEIHAYIIKSKVDSYGPVANALISMYSKSDGVEIAQKIVEHTLSSDLNVISFTALLEGYIKLGNLEPAKQIFDSMKNKDVVAWTAMIVGYVQNGVNDGAIALFRLMLKEGPKPNHYTLAAMLSVCSSLATLSHGKQIHAVPFRLMKHENS